MLARLIFLMLIAFSSFAYQQVSLPKKINVALGMGPSLAFDVLSDNVPLCRRCQNRDISNVSADISVSTSYFVGRGFNVGALLNARFYSQTGLFRNFDLADDFGAFGLSLLLGYDLAINNFFALSTDLGLGASFVTPELMEKQLRIFPSIGLRFGPSFSLIDQHIKWQFLAGGHSLILGLDPYFQRPILWSASLISNLVIMI